MKRSSPHVLLVAVIVSLLLGQSFAAALAQTPEASPVASPASQPGFSIADMDLSVEPGDDFYQFAGGGWMARTPIPPSGWGAPFDETQNALNDQILGIIEGIEPDPTTDLGKMRILFDQAMDTEMRNNEGIAPVQPMLDEIMAIDSIESGLAFHETAYATYTFFGPFDPWSEASPADPTTNIAWVGGVWLPLDPGLLLDESEDAQATRDAWVDATSRILVEMGLTEADAQATATGALAWYTSLAGIVTPEDELGGIPEAMNNPRTVAELETMLPGFDWTAFFASLGWQDQETVNIRDIAYFDALGDTLAAADPLALRHAYLAEMIWSGWARMLTTEIEEIAFSFDPGYLYGVTEMDPIELRARWFINEVMPDALGQAYVAKYFDEETRTQAMTVVDSIVEAFKVEIEQNTWLSDEGRANALERMDTLSIGIGHPETWATYSNIVVGDSLADTALSGYLNRNAVNLALVGTPVVTNNWQFPVYEPGLWLGQAENAFVISAARLQPPGFDPGADLATIYGGFGANVANVIAGTLDISDVAYADDGTRVSWYTEEDAAAYAALRTQVQDRLFTLEAYPGLPVTSEGQATATTWFIGGLPVAYNALQARLAAEGSEDNPWFLTQEQRFFVAWAGSNAAVLGPEAQDFAANQSFWPAPPIGAVEPLRHMEAFQQAFGIEPGDAEYIAPEDQIVIW